MGQFLDWADPNGSNHLISGWAHGFLTLPDPQPDPTLISLWVETIPEIIPLDPESFMGMKPYPYPSLTL
jgi:hypothetical protein